jgi:superfamily II RNA helicase
MRAGSFTAQQPLTIVEDPRVSASGVTDADLTAQFDLQMQILKLVNDTNLDVSRLNHALEELKTHPNKGQEKALKTLADQLLTPKIRYSQPGLQTHVTYLYSEIGKTDQRPGRDSTERYQELRQKIDSLTAQLDKLIGPVTTADINRFLAGDFPLPADDDDDDEQ